MVDTTKVLATVTTPLNEMGTTPNALHVEQLLKGLQTQVNYLNTVTNDLNRHIDDLMECTAYQVRRNEEKSELSDSGFLVLELSSGIECYELNLATGILTAERKGIKLSYQTEFNQDSELFKALAEYFEQY